MLQINSTQKLENNKKDLNWKSRWKIWFKGLQMDCKIRFGKTKNKLDLEPRTGIPFWFVGQNSESHLDKTDKESFYFGWTTWLYVLFRFHAWERQAFWFSWHSSIFLGINWLLNVDLSPFATVTHFQFNIMVFPW